MATVEEHYERLLAHHYSWMQGGHEVQVPACMKQFEVLDIAPRECARALDLGCGSGFQSLALAHLGFDVTSLDTSAALLDELCAQPGADRVMTIRGDIQDASLFEPRGPFETVVCMGDTLTHLDSFERVESLLKSARANLASSGVLVLGFRDLTRELFGIDRAIPVRHDPDRIMTVFLEYAAEHVHVHDIIYVRENGVWALTKSAYKKLRLGSERVIELLHAIGFQRVDHTVERGFSTIVAR